MRWLPQMRERAAEEYVETLGSSREQLTNKQWQIVVKAVGSMKGAKVAATLLPILAVVYICTSLLIFRSFWQLAGDIETNEGYTISEAGEEYESVASTGYTEEYGKGLILLGFLAGSIFGLALATLAVVFHTLLNRRATKKMPEAFVLRDEDVREERDSTYPPG